MKKLKICDICNCINDYYCIYGWAPTKTDIYLILEADNEKQISRYLTRLKEYQKVIWDGDRTLHTPQMQYLDERKKEFVKELKQRMTKKECEIYDYLVAYILKMNYAPTKREIAEYMGYDPRNSKSSVCLKLRNLEEMGAIRLGPKNTNRTIHVVGVNAKIQIHTFIWGTIHKKIE